MNENIKQENSNEIDLELEKEESVCDEISDSSNEIIALKAELEKAQNEFDKLKDAYIRANADFDNIKKRLEREKQDAVIFANEKIIKELFPLIDALEIAGNFEAIDDVTKGIKEGIKNVLNLFLNTLAKHGVSEIVANIGDEYSYELHEVVSMIECDLEPNKIAQIYQKGYTLNDRVLRACKVIISK